MLPFQPMKSTGFWQGAVLFGQPCPHPPCTHKSSIINGVKEAEPLPAASWEGENTSEARKPTMTGGTAAAEQGGADR